MSFGAHSESCKIQAHKKTLQMCFFTIFTAFGIFFPASQYAPWNIKYHHYEVQFVTQKISHNRALSVEK
ncbi:hypothetical protein GDO81_000915 [Engystomops pustulosus]|uniref:Uncharacterized protein n=1 Tax=Engystomops pustulosus TaxID=76066 RepID=A0AAV7D8D1_ENGPU|nr:hypothetical protein GDO81_000915 [Engystomops pustulosus]